jgi:acetyltransferase
MTHSLTPFFNPRGVALIGASANPGKLGHAVLHNLINSGYRGAVYPVNPNYPDIDGLPCYADIAAVPNPVDLAVLIVPAAAAPAALTACGRRGLKAAIIISGGFKETGPEGAALETECVAVLRRFGMRLIGPNGIGTMAQNSGLNTTFLRSLPQAGPIALVSQSGAVVGGVLDFVGGQHTGFSHVVSLGNAADVTETDIILYLADDPHARVLAVYAESITDGRRFMEAARQVSARKPIVLLKAGRTQAGGRAAASHTGALAGSHAAYAAALKQSGVIEVFSLNDLFNTALALAYQPLPQGNRLALVTNAGGPAVLAADAMASHNLRLADLSAGTQAALRARLNPHAPVSNPVDMLGGAEAADYGFALAAALADPGVDAALVTHVPQALVNPVQVARAIAETAQGAAKPVYACFMGQVSVGQAQQLLHQHMVPPYTFPEDAAQAIGRAVEYARQRQQAVKVDPPARPTVNAAAARAALACAQGALTEAAARPVLAAYGLPLAAGGLATTPAQAVELAEAGGYPAVLKIVSPDILHKSESGGIALNLPHAAAVQAAYRHIMERAAAAAPEARLTGVLVQKMAPPGHEVIVGVRRDPQFGPLLMFGLGGIYVELLTDVSFRVAPISRAEARAMIAETKAGRLLAGLRGQPPADIEAVVDCLVRLSQLALDFPQIEEVEVNPLRVLPQGEGALALDARLILGESQN